MEISVCMATYNGATYIQEQIISILEQLGDADELIISDDSSTDNTIQVIKSLNDSRIRLFENRTFRNPIFNFEFALKQAQGNIIFLADQDDIWLNGRVTRAVEGLQENVMVVCDCTIINEADDVLFDSFYKLRNSAPGLFHNLFQNTYLGCCMAFRRSILEQALPFPENIPMHDVWLGMVAELSGKTRFLPDKLIKYRRHNKNASSASKKSPYSFFQQLIFRKNIITNIIKRFYLNSSRN